MGTVLLFIFVDMVNMAPITGENIIIRDKKIYEKIENLICKYYEICHHSKKSVKIFLIFHMFYNKIPGSENFARTFCQLYLLTMKVK